MLLYSSICCLSLQLTTTASRFPSTNLHHVTSTQKINCLYARNKAYFHKKRTPLPLRSYTPPCFHSFDLPVLPNSGKVFLYIICLPMYPFSFSGHRSLSRSYDAHALRVLPCVSFASYPTHETKHSNSLPYSEPKHFRPQTSMCI